MSKKIHYTRDELGGIKFNSGRKPGEVRIPNYVYDMWLPLIGTDAIAVYAVYCRLERAEIVKSITMDTIAKCCRMSKTTLGKVNDVLVECGFIAIKKPEGNARAHHMTNEITVNDPPQKISAELIAKYQPASGYEPLSKWLCEVPDSTSREVPDSTSRSTEQYHEEVPDSTSTMLQPSVLQPSSVVEKPRPNPYATVDALITAWAEVRNLINSKHGANLYTGTRRKKAAEMMNWPISATVDEIKAVTKQGMMRKDDYPFEFLPNDLLEYRALKVKQAPKRIVQPEPEITVVPEPIASPGERQRMANEARIAFLKPRPTAAGE